MNTENKRGFCCIYREKKQYYWGESLIIMSESGWSGLKDLQDKMETTS
jgi:hypothetical protein